MKVIKRDMGLWIDLTSDCYYNKTVMENHGCKYVKINCSSLGETPPSEEDVMKFVHACSKFASKNPSKMIGVHCTNGFNRTGFLIISYLVLKLGWSVEAAVCEFARAR